MSLQNLVGISLDTIEPARATVAKLLAAVSRQLADAGTSGISGETRFAAAYTAIRMLADVGLHANGYRTLTSKPGHHQTAIQALPLTMGVPPKTVQVLDALRRQRNLTEYSGDLIPEATVVEAISQASALLAWTKDWLEKTRPELL